MKNFLFDVPEAMFGAGRDQYGLIGTNDHLFLLEPYLRDAIDHLQDLLDRMDVCRSTEPVVAELIKYAKLFASKQG